MSRYARQRSIAGVGDAGQARLGAAEATVHGDGLDAEVCALYLAGAGVGRLVVHRSLAERCREQNGEIEVREGAGAGPCAVEVGGVRSTLAGEDEVLRGASLARSALALIIGFGGASA